jgi:hypothetical protein
VLLLALEPHTHLAWAVLATFTGKIVNCSSSQDGVIKLCVKGLGVKIGQAVAGLDGICSARVQNLDMTAMIERHSDWLSKMPLLSRLVGLRPKIGVWPGLGCVGRRVMVAGKGPGVLRCV